jgi:ABC-type transporter Mla subunit MlaD
VTGFAQTLEAFDGRRRDIGATVRRAPAALRSAQATLASLESASAPLIPAARGLRASAPGLTRTLGELPRFTEDALPALDTIARVSPALTKLGADAAPIVRDLRPLSAELSTYTRSGLRPFGDLLHTAGADVLGTMEGWARSTQGRDAASHIFRFGATSGSDTLALLLQPPPARRKRPRTTTRDRAPQAGVPRPRQPQAPKLPARPRLPRIPDAVGGVADRLPEPVRKAVNDAGQATQDGEELLDFLLGP